MNTTQRALYNGCTRKRVYLSARDAQPECDRLIALSSEALEVYHCAYDDTHWHIGHAPRTRVPSTLAERIEHRLETLDKFRTRATHLTAWQSAYLEDVTLLCDELARVVAELG